MRDLETFLHGHLPATGDVDRAGARAARPRRAGGADEARPPGPRRGRRGRDPLPGRSSARTPPARSPTRSRPAGRIVVPEASGPARTPPRRLLGGRRAAPARDARGRARPRHEPRPDPPRRPGLPPRRRARRRPRRLTRRPPQRRRTAPRRRGRSCRGRWAMKSWSMIRCTPASANRRTTAPRLVGRARRPSAAGGRRTTPRTVLVRAAERGHQRPARGAGARPASRPMSTPDHRGPGQRRRVAARSPGSASSSSAYLVAAPSGLVDDRLNSSA